MLRLFTRSAVWDGWNELSALEKTELKKQLGPMFADNFINKSTRSYNSIDTDTLVSWAKTLKRRMPVTPRRRR